MKPEVQVNSWIAAMQQQSLISNWLAPLHSISLEGSSVPVAVGVSANDQTYLASPQHGYIDYARDECDQLSDASAQRWAKRGLSLAEPWFKGLKLDNSVSVNAWGVSTHLYPQWSSEQVLQLKEQLVGHYPHRPLWMRTLHEGYDASLMQTLKEQGWQLWPSRVVYGFDWKSSEQWMKQRNNQIDQKNLAKTTLNPLFPNDFKLEHASDMALLYRQLYVEKHSRWNAHYTPAYFEQAIQQKWLSFYGFADEAGQLVAFIGVFEQGNVMTTPMLGYDTQLPKTLGLYRLLMAQMLRLSVQQQKYLNLGAGSAEFKRMRGGVASIEWHGFYVSHLPLWRRWAMNATGGLMRRYVPTFLVKQAV
jgi:hypothetical protein